MKGSAVFSDDEVYRYLLVRRWEQYPIWMNFVMLNPSTATATENSPTIRKCITFAKQRGFTGIMVTNVFAYRASKPHDLRTLKHKQRVGPDNGKWIQYASDRAHRVVVAWGNEGRRYPRAVKDTLAYLGAPFFADLYCLGKTLDGQPSHPLMLSYQTTLERF